MKSLTKPVNALLCLLCLTFSATALAQQPQKVMPRVTIVHPGYTQMRQDLLDLFNLTSPKEKKYWGDLNGILQQFEQGIAKDKPVRTDVIVERSGFPMIVSVPVSDLKAFRENLNVLGIDSKRARRDKTLYVLGGKVYAGFMRSNGGYGSIGPTKNDVALGVLGQPDAAITDLLRRKFSMGAEIVNVALDAPSQATRRQKFQKPKKDLLSALKKMPAESRAAFEVRKLAVRHQLDEVERLLSETERLTFGARLKSKATAATLILDLKPIAGTGLARDLAAFGAQASMFGAIKRGGDAVLSLRINHPLSDLRKKAMTEFFTTALPDAIGRINDSQLSATDKSNSAEFAKLLSEQLKLGTDAGVLDAFVEVTPAAGGKYTSVSAIRVPEGTKTVELVTALSKSHSQNTLEASVAKYGEVDIHRLTVHTKYRAEFGQFFGDTHIIYVGTGGGALWSAVGPDAQAKLKAAIETVQKEEAPAATPVVIDFYAHLRPWIGLHDSIEAKVPRSRDAKVRSVRQQGRDIRKKALAAMTARDDVITIKISRVDDRLEGVTEVGTGPLRLLGKLLAKFSKEQLGLD